MIKQNPSVVSDALDCEQVFERLTAGPFPQDEFHEEHIQWHLRCCHECRTLAEAMRPAIGLIHESIADRARNDLPVFRGTLPATDPALLAVRSAIAAEEHGGERPEKIAIGARRKPCVPKTRGGRIAAVLAASLLLFFAFVGGMSAYPLVLEKQERVASTDANTAPISTMVSFHDPEQLLDPDQFLDWVGHVGCNPATQVSRELFSVHESVIASMTNRVCCSDCHTPAMETDLAAEQIAGIVNACGTCHATTN